MINEIHNITRHLLLLVNDLECELENSLKGNMAAAQRARVITLELQKVGKMYRRESLAASRSGYMKKIKKTRKEYSSK